MSTEKNNHDASKVSTTLATVDLYAALGLNGLETDRQSIEDALRRCVRIAKQTKDPSAARRAAKLLKLGKANLLNVQRKQAYDALWTSKFGGQSNNSEAVLSKSEQVELEWDWEPLAGLLPEGDATAPFDMNQFLSTTDAANQTETSGLDQMLAVIDVSEEPSQLQTPEVVSQLNPTTPSIESVPVDVVAKPVALSSTDATLANHSVENVTAKQVAAPDAVPQQSHSSQPKNVSLAKSLRKKRDRSLLFTAIAMLGGVAVLLGVILVVLNFGRSDETQTGAMAARGANSVDTPDTSGLNSNRQTGQVTLRTDQGENRTTRVGSGLPSVQMPMTNPASGSGEVQMDAPSKTVSSRDGDADSANLPIQKMNSGALDSGDASSMAATPDANSSSGGDAQATPSVRLSAAEKVAWKSEMTAIRELLGQHDYTSAKSRLESVKSQVQTQEQEAQLTRLETAAELAEQGFEALLRAMSALDGGSTFKVGSLTVAFVEGGNQRLVVRIRGNNQRYELTQIPVGILRGLLDLELDLVNARDKAKRAAFVLFHPAANELSTPWARRMMEEAEGENAVPSGTSLLFDDTYDL